jgi:hypothetical protein
MKNYTLHFKIAGTIDIEIYNWMRSTSEGFSVIMKAENALGLIMVYIANVKHTIGRK